MAHPFSGMDVGTAKPARHKARLFAFWQVY